VSYLTVITLDDAKLHLRVDHTASDAEITRMISSALSFLERRTNIIVYDRQQTYYYLNSCVNVYDGPINTVVSSTSHTQSDFGSYSRFTDYSGAKSIDLTVGHLLPANVPAEIIDAALEMIDYWYYKNDGRANTMLIPESVQQVIDTIKRYVI